MQESSNLAPLIAQDGVICRISAFFSLLGDRPDSRLCLINPTSVGVAQ